jgi:hypothetical protein
LIKAICASGATPLEFSLDCFALPKTTQVIDSFDEVEETLQVCASETGHDTTRAERFRS